jgi:hypothetical protein
LSPEEILMPEGLEDNVLAIKIIKDYQYVKAET